MGSVLSKLDEEARRVARDFGEPFEKVGNVVKRTLGLKKPHYQPPEIQKFQASTDPKNIVVRKSKKTNLPGTLLTGSSGTQEKLGSTSLLGG